MYKLICFALLVAVALSATCASTITNCTACATDANVCTTCATNYQLSKANAGKCYTIVNCQTYSTSEDKCATCKDTFKINSDKTKCESSTNSIVASFSAVFAMIILVLAF